MVIEQHSATSRSLKSARQVPFVYGPLVIIGGVLTATVLLALIGLPVLLLSVAMIRMASTARRRRGVWSRWVRPVAALSAGLALVCSLLALRFGVKQEFRFSSSWSSFGLAVLWLWSIFIVTMSVSIIRFGIVADRSAETG